MAKAMQKTTVSTVETKEVASSSVKKEKKKFDQADGIKCRSVIQGGLYYEGDKTKMLYSFSDYGDTTDIEYRDLVAAVRTKSPYVFNPYFIIDDEDFIDEYPTLRQFYQEKFTTTDLRSILDLPVSDMLNTIDLLPKTAVESLKQIAATEVSMGRLDSVRKIKALDQVFGTDLNLMSEIFSNN